MNEYTWVVVFGIFAAFFAAFGIGANDVANAYATSVGSKALTVKQACALAVVFEFLGAFLGGGAVADTIRKGIGKTDCFEGENDAALLMYGNLCVVTIVGFWLLVASWAEMPVSTTHSCVGGMIGMTIVLKGADCVVWSKPTDSANLYIPKGVIGIVLSWVFSPVLSGIFAVILFTVTRKVVLRSAASFDRAIKFYPVLVWIMIWINVFFTIAKGAKKKICTDENWLCNGKGKPNAGVAAGFSCGVGLAAALLLFPLYGMIRKRVDGMSFDDSSSTDAAPAPKKDLESSTTDAAKVEVVEPTDKMGKFKKAMMTSLDTNPHASIEEDTSVNAIHANAEKFSPKAEAVFRYIQIATAIFDSFAHGANDVANAMGPFMAIWAIYQSGSVSKKSDTDDDGLWILALGGIGIGLGLVLYGYKIMRAIGVKLAVITPSRGYAIELGAAIVIILGSYLGIPLSTTHCQVGATTGVALMEGGKGVNKFILMKCVVGWILTLIVVGINAGFLVAQGVHAPMTGTLQEQLFDRACDGMDMGDLSAGGHLEALESRMADYPSLVLDVNATEETYFLRCAA